MKKLANKKLIITANAFIYPFTPYNSTFQGNLEKSAVAQCSVIWLY